MMRLRNFGSSTCLILVAASFGPVARLGAQTPPPRVGIIAGINSSTFAGIDATNPTPTPLKRFVGGLVFDIPTGPNWVFEPELLLTMKGAEEKDASSDGVFRMSYLQLPILFRYDFDASGRFKPFVLGGWAVAFMTSCTLEQTASGSTSTFSCSQLRTPTGGAQISALDYSGILGGGVGFNIGKKMFTIGGRLDHSFNAFEMNADIKHSVLSAVATFELPLSW